MVQLQGADGGNVPIWLVLGEMVAVQIAQAKRKDGNEDTPQPDISCAAAGQLTIPASADGEVSIASGPTHKIGSMPGSRPYPLPHLTAGRPES